MLAVPAAGPAGAAVWAEVGRMVASGTGSTEEPGGVRAAVIGSQVELDDRIDRSLVVRRFWHGRAEKRHTPFSDKDRRYDASMAISEKPATSTFVSLTKSAGKYRRGP